MANDESKALKLTVQLAELRKEYLARLPAEMAELETLHAQLSKGENVHENLDKLYHRLHKLSGSGGTFGLSNLSTRARNLEQRVKALLILSPDTLDDHEQHELAAALLGLVEAIEHGETQPPSIAPLNVVNAGTALGQATVVWLVEDDAYMGSDLKRQLESFNYVVTLFSCMDAAEAAAATDQPHMLIMDVMFEHESENSTQAYSRCVNLNRLACPLLFISSCDDFQSRVRAAQLGAEGYVLKPLDVPRLVSRMVQILEQRRDIPQRVLIADDDKELSEHYRLLLESAGMAAEILQNPEDIIEQISAFQPELILMDINMPVYTGLDLAGVIRQYDKWDSLPIIYISSETDLDQQMEALARGGDDFLTKPVSDSQLIAAVHIHIERGRYLQAKMSKDGLTGLLKHASIKEAVNIEVICSRRSNKPATICMLDIDHFKRVNDTYGHAIGDVVISAVAMLLRQRLRQSDVVGRYGGEEFAAVLADCNAESAHQIAEDIRQRFAALSFTHEGQEFSCTLSIGFACTEQFPGSDGSSLLISADEALYLAKDGGAQSGAYRTG